MAKAKRGKPEEAGSGGPLKSVLEVAWRAWQDGNVRLARRAADKALAGPVTEADEALAKRVAEQLFGPGQEADAKKVAAEIGARTRISAKSYFFVLVAAAIWLVMIAIAHRG